jgi:hypothetical protein
MTQDPDDLVQVASGDLVRIEAYQQALKAARVESRVVGEDLATGLGTLLPNTIELWVHRADADRASAAIRLAEAERDRPPHDPVPHGRPKNDPKPKRPDTHGPHPHYNPDPRS